MERRENLSFENVRKMRPLIEAVLNSELVKEIPKNDNEIEEWVRDNPEKAGRIDRLLDFLVKEFRED